MNDNITPEPVAVIEAGPARIIVGHTKVAGLKDEGVFVRLEDGSSITTSRVISYFLGQILLGLNRTDTTPDRDATSKYEETRLDHIDTGLKAPSVLNRNLHYVHSQTGSLRGFAFTHTTTIEDFLTAAPEEANAA